MPKICGDCGNGVMEGEEACDDGNSDNFDGCAGDCGSTEVGFACESKPEIPV